MAKPKRQSEIEYVLDELHLGIHSGDGSGINRLHWIGFVDFIIKNPQNPKKQLIHKLISVLCVRERTVLEYINCSIAWGVLKYDNGMLHYNNTYNNTYHCTNRKKIVMLEEKTDEEILRDRSKV